MPDMHNIFKDLSFNFKNSNFHINFKRVILGGDKLDWEDEGLPMEAHLS